jgi:hypothetical protein
MDYVLRHLTLVNDDKLESRIFQVIDPEVLERTFCVSVFLASNDLGNAVTGIKIRDSR